MSWARSALIIWSLECFFCPWTFNEPYELLRFLHFPARQIVSSCRSDSCLVLVQAPWTAGARFLIPCVRGFTMREYWMLMLSILPAKVNGSRISLLSHQAALWVFIQTLPVVLPVSMSDFMFFILMNHLKDSKWASGLKAWWSWHLHPASRVARYIDPRPI